MNILPNKNDFAQFAKKGNLVPVYTEIVADIETPVSAYYKIIDKDTKYSFLLESVEGGENIGRYSFLGSNPYAIFIQENGVAKLISDKASEVIEGQDIFEKVNKVIHRFKPVEIPELPSFTGGAIGYVSYDIISEVETTVPVAKIKRVDVPEALFMLTDSILIFDKVNHTIIIIAYAHVTKDNFMAEYDVAVSKIKQIVEKLQKPHSIPSVNIPKENITPVLKSNKSKKEYFDMVETAKNYIVNGDIIQAVLSQRFEIDMPYSPLAVHRALRMVNPSPYMFLLDCNDFSIVGASPEVHAKCEDRIMTVRPIAGTRKRGTTKAKDIELEKELLDDPKERAEHIMLVDLARNDLGRIAIDGSVDVDEFMIVERYSHVMHIVSNVNAKLKDELQSDAVMRSTFPAGTLSGAPKVRAMQIISELEKEQRGPYGGAVAYYSFNGDLNSAITIRTTVIKDGKAYIQAGAGIVADSVPGNEYEETQNKAKGMIKALALAKHFDFSD